MPNLDDALIDQVRQIVEEHYQKDSSPLMLSTLGARLRKDGLWEPDKAKGRTLRQVLEAAHDPELVLVRDPDSPAFVAVTTSAQKKIVDAWIERRSQAATSVPSLNALPRSVLVAFCVPQEPGRAVFISKRPPFKYQICPRSEANLDELVEIDEKYRRPGLDVRGELSASDRLDLQMKITTWSKDTNIPIDSFYVRSPSQTSNALERLIEAQPRGVAERMVIPGDIALLLSRRQ